MGVSAKPKESNEQSRAPKTKPASVAVAKEDSFWTQVFLAGLIIFITFAAYQPAIKAGFVWDDDDMVTENAVIQGGLPDIWFTTKFYDYYPLTLTSLWIEWKMWGMNPKGYHVVNILLHALTSVLLWRVFRQLKIPGAWLAALVFAIHPVNVESVAWIAERKNTLPMVFYGLTLMFFLRNEVEILKKGADASDATFNVSRWYWFSVVAFLLALLSKTSVVMLPFVLLGCIWWQKDRIGLKDFYRTVPFFLLSLILGLVTVWVQYNRAISTDVVQTSGFFEKLARAGWAVWFYCYKALVPVSLSFVYPRWEVDSKAAISYLPGILVFVCLGIFWKFRHGWGKPFLFGFAYFVVTLFPVIGFFSIYFQKYSFVADHWQYTSIIGVIALVVGLGAYLQKKFPGLIVVGVAVVAGLCFQTWKQSSIYQNDETLFRDTIAKNPKSWLAQHTLAVTLAQQAEFFGSRGNIPVAQAKFEEAMSLYRKTIEIKPDHAFAHFNLGRSLMQMGKIDEALVHYKEAVRVDMKNPGILGALQMLAWVYATSEKEERRNGAEAVRLAEYAAQSTERKDSAILDTLGAAYAEAGRFDEAVSTITEAMGVAEKEGDAAFVKEMDSRRRFYRTKRPFRDSSL